MQMLAMLCGVDDAGQKKIIALSPSDNQWFVNAVDATSDYQEMIRETEADGKLTVLGFLFGPSGERGVDV